MAEPTSVLSYYDLILRIARESGVSYYGASGAERAMIPIDPHDLDLCKQIVNDAIRLFIASGPRKGWRWMHRLAEITFDADGTGLLNIDNDPARYLLPENFGGEVDGNITYAANTNHATDISWVDESFIRQRRSITVVTSYPLFAATLPYQPTDSSLGSRRYELIVDASPSANDTIVFPYTMYFNDMKLEAGEASAASATTLADSTLTGEFPDDYFNTWVIKIISGTGKNSYATVTDYVGSTGTFTVADWLSIGGIAGGTDPDSTSIYYVEPASNLHPAGLKFDEAIKAACLAQAELQVEDIAAGYMDLFLNVSLKAAWNKDANSAPRTLGSMYKGRRFSGIRERTFATRTYT